MPLITEIVSNCPRGLRAVFVSLDRHTLSKRRWRTTAEDGTDLAVDLAQPCKHGDVIWTTTSFAYVIDQCRECVVEITLPESPSAAAELGWFLGNQHLPVEVTETSLRLEANPHLVELLRHQAIAHLMVESIFSPAPHSAGHSHHHRHNH